MNLNGILCVLKIDKRGLCSFYSEFENARKKYEPQLIAGFFYAMSTFADDYFGEGLREIQTNNYKVVFQKDDGFLNVYIVENQFNDYELLKPDVLLNYSVS